MPNTLIPTIRDADWLKSLPDFRRLIQKSVDEAEKLRFVSQNDGILDIVMAHKGVTTEFPLDQTGQKSVEALIDQGLFDEAIATYGQCIQDQRERVAAHCRLANTLLHRGRSREADACCRKALELAPDDAEAHNQLGQVLQATGNLTEAFRWYRRGLQLHPQYVAIHFNLARLYQDNEQYALALNHFERVVQLVPEFAPAHHGLGTINHEEGKLDLALEQYRKALRLRPDFSLAHCSVGIVHQEKGDFELAEDSFREAIRFDPDCSDAFAHLAGLLRQKLPEADIAAARRLAATSNPTISKRSMLYYGLALVDDARRDYRAAADDLQLAKSLSLTDRKLRGIVYQPDRHDQFVDTMIENFSDSYFERVRCFGLNSERPVFIMGLPRSGTTLTEQILASHSQVYGAGELGLGWSAFNSLAEIAPHKDSASTRFSNLDAGCIERIARNCLERLASIDGTALRITDKLPDNYLYMGLLATMFPQAKFIHCRRDLRDVAVSCWMTDFRRVHWTNHFDHIASRFHSYERLMSHWRNTLPVPILEINYEEIVSDLENTARRLVEWCQLDWEPACISFHNHRRSIRTASATQIRQSIYTSSVGRWRHYEPFLAPMFAMLPNRTTQ